MKILASVISVLIISLSVAIGTAADLNNKPTRYVEEATPDRAMETLEHIETLPVEKHIPEVLKEEPVTYIVEETHVETTIVDEVVYQEIVTTDTVEDKKPAYNCTEKELEDLAILVYLEAGGESYECQKAVAECIFNRLESGIWGNTLTEVIYAENQFEPAIWISTSSTTDNIRELVYHIYMNGSTLDKDILFFRAWYYHQWYGAVAEFNIGDVYFSSSTWCS